MGAVVTMGQGCCCCCYCYCCCHQCHHCHPPDAPEVWFPRARRHHQTGCHHQSLAEEHAKDMSEEL